MMTMDDGADLRIGPSHPAKNLLSYVIGGTEETTTGSNGTYEIEEVEGPVEAGKEEVGPLSTTMDMKKERAPNTVNPESMTLKPIIAELRIDEIIRPPQNVGQEAQNKVN
jgi:hypothetical protein